jgi:hypothetical protein
LTASRKSSSATRRPDFAGARCFSRTRTTAPPFSAATTTASRWSSRGGGYRWTGRRETSLAR